MLPSNASEWETAEPSSKPGGPKPRGGLFVTLALLAVLIGVIVVAVTRLPTGSLSRPTAATAPQPAAPPAAAVAGGAGVPADAATQQAIQQVIRRLDEAQAQAIATDDPRVMIDTATPDFYRQQVAINQDLVEAGVVEIKLLNMEWGQITVDGNTATASVYETWSTTFDDGGTEQARDLNVYTLVKDSSGNWKVHADEHPEAR
jgi:biopolymer transport protein ExbD